MSSENLEGRPPEKSLSREEEAIATIELHPQAKNLIEKLILDFGSSLLLQAKIIAHRRHDDMVLRSHVEEALDVIHLERKQKWWKSFVTILGGVFFGAGARGFITELQGSREPTIITIYVILAFVGLLMAVYPASRRQPNTL